MCHHYVRLINITLILPRIFSTDPHTNEIIGVAYDVFDPNVSCEEFNQFKPQAAEADGEEVENADPSNKVNDALARGKHYTVFSFQNWSSKHKSIHFVVARYALETHSSRWLRKTNRSVVTFLGSFHNK